MSAKAKLINYVLIPLGGLLFILAYIALNAYTIWRTGTLIENAIADPAATTNSSSEGASGEEGGVPDHGTLKGLWVGLAWGVATVPMMVLPLVVGAEHRVLQSVCRWLSRVAYTAVATVLWAAGALLVWEVVNACVPAAHGDAAHGRGALASVLAVAGVAAAATAAHLASSLALRTRHVTLRSRRVRAPLTLAHISDVHIGSRTARWLRRVVAAVNAAPCDAVVVSGDLFDYPGVQERELDALRDVRSPVYAVSGNHDLATGARAHRRLYAHLAPQVTLLDDAAAPVPGPSGAVLLGVCDTGDKQAYLNVARTLSDKCRKPSEGQQGQEQEPYRVLINHRPWGFETVAREDIADLFLSGHTHAGGQLLLFLPLVKAAFPTFHGHYVLGDHHMYCSPGTGTWGPYAREWGFNLVTFIHILPEDEHATNALSASASASASASSESCALLNH